jgi:hypothetical protein
VAAVWKIGLSISALAVLAFALAMKISSHDGGALCGGRRFEISTVPNGASPYIELSADGVEGHFLLDYGATRSSLSAARFTASDGAVRRAAISLPGFEKGDFDLSRYDLMLQPEKGQLGVIGADFLSQLSVQLTGRAAYLGPQPCRPEALRARGLVPIAESGFFSSDPSKIGRGLPNVPVVFLRLGEVRTWAQIDTGYDDIVYKRSVDINEALYERLIESGAKLQRGADLRVWTCEGPETRRVYTANDYPLAIETDEAKPIVETKLFHLIVKSANGCGGIGAMTEPAAQLGASFLQMFGTVVFDPKSGTVWLEGAAGKP